MNKMKKYFALALLVLAPGLAGANVGGSGNAVIIGSPAVDDCLKSGGGVLIKDAGAPCGTGSGGSPGGSNTEFQYNNSGAFGGATMYYDSVDHWFGFNITPEATVDVLNIQARGSGANTAARFQASDLNPSDFYVTVADAADGWLFGGSTPSFSIQLADESTGTGLNLSSSAIASTIQLLNTGGDILNAYDVTTGGQIVLGNGAFFQASNSSYFSFMGNVAAFSGGDNNGNIGTIADGINALNTTGPVIFLDSNTSAVNFSVQTGGAVKTSFSTLDDGSGQLETGSGAIINLNSTPGAGFAINGPLGAPFAVTADTAQVNTLNNILDYGDGSMVVNSGGAAANPFTVYNLGGQTTIRATYAGQLGSVNNLLDDGNGNMVINESHISGGGSFSVYDGSGNTQFNVNSTDGVNTLNNTLDDGFGNMNLSGTLSTGGGADTWLFGAQTSAVSTLNTTQYIGVTINGTPYKLATMN